MASRGPTGDPDGDLSDSDGCMADCGGMGPMMTGKEPKEQPIFLRKTYQMLETCPAHIACWSDSGESFYIKDPDAFAQKVIPQFFAHSNFSSFVRQLNFYGFRKVKSDSKSHQQHNGKWWEFKHAKFQRGKQHLLSQIRRATHGASNEQEVNHLKTELCQLKGQIEEMSSSIEKLTSLVNDLMVDKMKRERPDGAQKKRKSSPFELMEEELGMLGDDTLGMVKSEYDETASSHLACGGGDPYYCPSTTDRPFEPVSDDEFTAMLDNLGTCSPERAPSPAPPSPWGQQETVVAATPMAVVDAQEDDEMSALQQSLSNLSPELQQKLVETLVDKLGSEVQPRQGGAAASRAASAIASASASSPSPAASSSSQANPATPHSAPIALPLASAVLGAFLTQYAQSQMAQEPMVAKPQHHHAAPAARKGIRSQG